MRNPIFPYRITAIVGANVIKGGSGGGGGGGVAPTVSNISTNAASAANGVSLAMASNVTSGNVLVLTIVCFESDSGWSGLTVGQLAKSAGTATIGTITLDKAALRSGDDDAGIYSVPITGSGSLTMTWTSGGSAGNTYVNIAAVEVTNMDSSATRVNATNSVNTGSGTSFSAGSVATGGAGIIFGAFTPASPYGAITITENGSFSLISEVQNDSPENYSFIYRSVTADTTDDPRWTLGTSASPVGVAVAYKSSTP